MKADDVIEGQRFDLLVIGSGLAGMAAALEAAEQGARVALAAAGPGSSERAQGGVAAAVGAGDDPGLHAADTLGAGGGLCDPDAVLLLTREAAQAIGWLAAHGVAFDEAGGRPALALEAAHSRPRILHAGGDRSGASIVAALRRKLDRVVLFEGVELEGLLVADAGVAGARLRGRGQVTDVRADATILATGGYAGLFARTTTSAQCDGFGLVAALLAGAELADLEFVQFHPTVYAGPGQPFLLTEALRGAGAGLTDREGYRFLFEADPRGELAPRAVVARAIAEHLRDSGQPAVFLDARHLEPALLQGHFAGFLTACRRVGVDPLREPVPIAPAAHYTMGGIVTDAWGRTSVPGLYAAGECARTGVHGANRLASNSLLEAVVFGRRAGMSGLSDRAGARAAGRLAGLTGGGNLGLETVRATLDHHAGTLRDADRLAEGLRRLQGSCGSEPRTEAARQLACLVLQAALIRSESRGAHVRTDHPEEAASWGALEILAGPGRDGIPALRLDPRQRPAQAAS